MRERDVEGEDSHAAAEKSALPPSKTHAEMRQAALDGGISPLEYMLNVMRDETASDERRAAMAKAAASYLHAKLGPEKPESLDPMPPTQLFLSDEGINFDMLSEDDQRALEALFRSRS